MKWISVYDKLPEERKTVLVYTERKECHTGAIRGKFWIIGGRFDFDIGKATHWMPIPKPPKS